MAISSRSKYNAKKILKDGEVFHSKKEYKRWVELKTAEKSGLISELKRQVKYELVPACYEEQDTPKGKKWRCVERPVSYYADFVYKDSSGITIVEDTKGVRTADYIIKRKLMLHVHNIKIREI